MRHLSVELRYLLSVVDPLRATWWIKLDWCWLQITQTHDKCNRTVLNAVRNQGTGTERITCQIFSSCCRTVSHYNYFTMWHHTTHYNIIIVFKLTLDNPSDQPPRLSSCTRPSWNTWSQHTWEPRGRSLSTLYLWVSDNVVIVLHQRVVQYSCSFFSSRNDFHS